MTCELWNLIEEYIDARLELEKVPEEFRKPMYFEQIRQQRTVNNLRERILDLLELANK